ncbi:MAG: hypothetical protein KJ650_00815 [Firmicutes bacterium]|nr:hypothetical protein [Bacillota bacterium]MBV1727312.1 hypothetical protein [Desulforudis sp.]MBV1736415.1 hypothetical protein [Desulforudis sp.]
MTKHADWPPGKLLEIRMSGCVLILGEQELLSLLAQDQALWQAALQRGKAVRRREQTAKRQATRR